MHTTLLRAFLIGILLLASNPSFADTVSFTGSFTGSALMYDPATDFSPSICVPATARREIWAAMMV